MENTIVKQLTLAIDQNSEDDFDKSLTEYIRLAGSREQKKHKLNLRRGSNKVTFLIYAVKAHFKYGVIALTRPDMEVDMEIADEFGYNPLMFAVMLGDANILEVLKIRGVNTRYTTPTGLTVVHMAVVSQSVYILNYLMGFVDKRMIDVADNSGLTPLHMAVLYSNKPMVVALLKYGASINSTTLQGSTPLHFAAYNHSLYIVRLLLANGADPHLANNYRETPFHVARRSVVEVSIQFRRDVEQTLKDAMSKIKTSKTHLQPLQHSPEYSQYQATLPESRMGRLPSTTTSATFASNAPVPDLVPRSLPEPVFASPDIFSYHSMISPQQPASPELSQPSPSSPPSSSTPSTPQSSLYPSYDPFSILSDQPSSYSDYSSMPDFAPHFEEAEQSSFYPHSSYPMPPPSPSYPTSRRLYSIPMSPAYSTYSPYESQFTSSHIEHEMDDLTISK